MNLVFQAAKEMSVKEFTQTPGRVQSLRNDTFQVVWQHMLHLETWAQAVELTEAGQHQPH